MNAAMRIFYTLITEFQIGNPVVVQFEIWRRWQEIWGHGRM